MLHSSTKDSQLAENSEKILKSVVLSVDSKLSNSKPHERIIIVSPFPSNAS